MANINQFRFSFGQSAYDKLSRESTQVGSPELPLTCDRDDPRKSIIDGTDVLADVADLRLVSGIFVSSSLKGDTNLIDTDACNWDTVEIGGTITCTDLGGGEYEFNFNGSTSFGLAVDAIFSSIVAGVHTESLEFQLVSGDSSQLSLQMRDGSGTIGSISLADMSSSYKRYDVSGTIANVSTSLLRVSLGTAPINCTFRVRNARAVKSSVLAAGFPDGSPAGTSYAADELTCTPVWTPQGTIMQAVTPYGDGTIAGLGADMYSWRSENEFIGYWDNTLGYPRYTGSGFTPDFSLALEDGGRGNTLITSYSWDGVNVVGRYQQESSISNAEADTPSGALYIGNRADASRPFHGKIVTELWPRVLSDADYEIKRAGWVARLG